MTRPLTVASVLTPPGRAAVATIQIRGSRAIEAAERFFQPARGGSVRDYPFNRIVFGRWADDQHAIGEELVLCRPDADCVEVHCHGGRAATAAILADLGSMDVPSQKWSEMIGRESRTLEAAAWQAMIHAPSERTAAILLDQHRGALRTAVDRVVDLIEAGQPDQAADELTSLLDHATVGRHLIKPWKVVLTGSPNVGKSSLINCLAGYQRAIVFDQPGTTRDVVTSRTAMDGWPVELADTAGLRPSDDEIERQGVQRAHQQADLADLVLLVSDDPTETASTRDGFVRQFPDHRSRPCLLVRNKSDLASSRPRGDGIRTSAITGEGIELLIEAIVSQLVPNPPLPGQAVPFLDEQTDACTRARAAIRSGETARAKQILTAVGAGRI